MPLVQADLAAPARGEAYELGRRGHHKLGGLGVGLDPVLLVRGDVDEEDRVEARRRLVQLGLQLAQARGRLPVDLLRASPRRCGRTPRKRRGSGTDRGESLSRRAGGTKASARSRTASGAGYAMTSGSSGTVRSVWVNPSQSPPRRRSGPDPVGASRRNAEREADDDAFATAQGKPTIDPASRRARHRIRRLHALAEKETRFEPRKRDRLSVGDLERRDWELARDDPVRCEGNARRPPPRARGDL